VILPANTVNSKAGNLATLLTKQLPAGDSTELKWEGASAVSYWQAAGSQPHWYEAYALLAAPPAEAPPPPPPVKLRKARLLKRNASEQPTQQFFSRSRHYAMRLGTAMHQLAAQLTWLDETPPQRLNELAQLLSPDFRAAAVRELQISLQRPAIAQCFLRPTGRYELWRERAFTVVQEGIVLHGKFDRVVVEMDAAGAATSATIIEYKTDFIRTTAEQAAAVQRALPQMENYRLGLGKILQLSSEHIRCELLFLSSSRPDGGRVRLFPERTL
jgi:ATP-dependent exoDNAse (exonuclease V) beta subunit